jgi:NTE family protein
VAFSGGGNRAAALAYGVLEQLAADRIEHDGRSARMLDEVDVISSVSGGSVVAAYYALNGDGIFHGFRHDYLGHDVQGDLWRASLWSPANWVRLASSRYSRGDLLADYLDRHLFHGRTFADLQRLPNRPFIVINTTDLSASGRFEFTQDWFDMICVDLGRYSIARAVAASSAYPIMLTPITLENRAGGCGYAPSPRINRILQAGALSRETNLAMRIMAYQDVGRIRYLHLADGALADNLGIRTAIDVLLGTSDFQEAQGMLGLKGIRRVAIVTVNAAGVAGENIAMHRAPPGLVDMATLSGSALIEDAATQNRALLRELLSRWANSSDGPAGGAPAIDTYWIDVELDALRDAPRRERLRAIPTSFSVAPAQVDELVCSARELLAASPAYVRLLHDLSGAAPASETCQSRAARD